MVTPSYDAAPADLDGESIYDDKNNGSIQGTSLTDLLD